MTTNLETEILDCRGQRCPGPILALSKRARKLGDNGGLIEVRADDPAFILDLKSWCRSTKNELLHLDDDGGAHLALVRVPSKLAPPPPPPPVPAPVLAAVEAAAAPSVTELDCRGARCPEPILRMSRLARQVEPGTIIEIQADDDAFEIDLESWCRSAGAKILEMRGEPDGTRRALVQTKSSSAGPSSNAQPLASSRPAAPVPGPPPPGMTQLAPLGPALQPPTDAPEPAAAAIVADLRGMQPEEVDPALDSAARRAGVGKRIRVLGVGVAAAARIVGWCAERGHRMARMDTEHAQRAEIVVEALTPTTALAIANEARTETPAADCTLLVLHNDHEALLAALLVAVGAASQGKDVAIFFTFWGLNLLRGDAPNEAMPKEKVSWMQRMMKMMMPKGPKRQSLGKMHFGGAGKAMLGSIMKKQNIMTLPKLLQTAEAQGVRFIACTMSMEVMGITKRDLAPRSNVEYGGVAAFVEAAYGAGMSLVF